MPSSYPLKATIFLAVTLRNLKLVNVYLGFHTIIKIFLKVGRSNIFKLKVISVTSVSKVDIWVVVLPWAYEFLEAGLLRAPSQSM